MDRSDIRDSFLAVRNKSEELCRPLATEDYVVQPIDDVSPPKWHIGHTSWFFERVILQEHVPDFEVHHPQYPYIFNSYYESLGERVMRNLRGTLSRPTVDEVMTYRKKVTEQMLDLIDNSPDTKWDQLEYLIRIGMNHEQQHQELFLMDIKYIYAANPLKPSYSGNSHSKAPDAPSMKFIEFKGGMNQVGAENGNGFAYDNEFPRHKVFIRDFKLADRLVTCGEYLDFMNDGGYENHMHWLSDGWAVVEAEGWKHPLHWFKEDDEWKVMTLSGPKQLDPNEPVSHVSFYEAAAYARWAHKRLPTEDEWEIASEKQNGPETHGRFMDDNTFHPLPDKYNGNGDKLQSLMGDLWEWTNSSYLPYPGYHQTRDALGEYNGKFMSNQMVMRGGCCATPKNHIRNTYRNFFQPDKRWQFSGIRLAEDA